MEDGLEGELLVLKRNSQHTQTFANQVPVTIDDREAEDVESKHPFEVQVPVGSRSGSVTRAPPMMRAAELPTPRSKQTVLGDVQAFLAGRICLCMLTPIILAVAMLVARSARLKQAMAMEQLRMSGIGCEGLALCHQHASETNEDMILVFFKMFGLQRPALQLKLDRFLQEPHVEEKVEQLFMAMGPNKADTVCSTEMCSFFTEFWSRVSNPKAVIQEKFPLPNASTFDSSLLQKSFLVPGQDGRESALLHRSNFQKVFRLALAWHIAQEAQIERVYNGKVDDEKLSKMILGFMVHMTV